MGTDKKDATSRGKTISYSQQNFLILGPSKSLRRTGLYTLPFLLQF